MMLDLEVSFIKLKRFVMVLVKTHLVAGNSSLVWSDVDEQHYLLWIWFWNFGCYFWATNFQQWKSVFSNLKKALKYCQCDRSVSGKSVSDHLVYYGVELSSPAWRSCRFVMDPPLAASYGTTDLNGNRVFSRDPEIPLIRLKEPSSLGGKSW